MIFGGVTVVCGILGTITGGFVLDFMTNTIPNAFKVGFVEFRENDLGLLSLILFLKISALFSSC